MLWCKTGGAHGSDAAFYDVLHEVVGDVTEVYTFNGHKIQGGYDCLHMLTYEELFIGWRHALEANKVLKRNIYGLHGYIKNLIARNYHIVHDSQFVLAIGRFQRENIVHGGTGWGVQFAIMEEKPIYFYEVDRDEWYHYNYALHSFEQNPLNCIFSLKEGTFAGIGSRKIDYKRVRKALNKIFYL